MNLLNENTKPTLGILNPADFTNEEKYGGAGGFIKSILPSMIDYDVIIFGLGINGKIPWKPVQLSHNQKFIPIADFKFPSKIPMRLKSLYAYSFYRNKILNYGIDLLYVHFPEICLPFLFFNNDVPVVYHQHGFSNPLHASKYTYGKLHIFKKFYDIARIIIYKNANWIIQIDQIGLQQSALHGAKNKTSLLLNAVNTNHFKPNDKARNYMRKQYRISDDVVAIINTGRIEKQKGLQRLIKTIPLLKNKRIKFHIFLVGDGTYKRKLEDMVKAYQAEKDISFLGRIPHQYLPDYYNMADIFVLPSEREGVPMAILESLACGTPVVSNKVGGIPNFLRNGVNGMLLEDLSCETIASTVNNVILSKYDRRKVSKTIEHIGADRAVAFLNDIFFNVLSKNNHSHIKRFDG